MCDHFIGFHTYQRFQAPRALWRCGSCGRESSAPIDCCTRPNFSSARAPGSIGVGLRWLGEVGSWVMTHLRTLEVRRRRPAIEIIDTQRAHGPTDGFEVEAVETAQWTDASTDLETVEERTHVSV